jgi:hypothetical protein
MAIEKPQAGASDILPKPDDKDFKKPVSWLLGPQLIASFKWTALYIAFKNKLDPRDWMQANIYHFDEQQRLHATANADEFWFDYFADTGDGQRATYSIAYMCLSDLWVEAPAALSSAVAFDKQNLASATHLPRGEFLFVGGDTSYHIADYATVAKRFQAPFHWAFGDLKKAGKVTDDDPRRPLFGLPGNHDYYDVIDGFNRQFRLPTSPENIANQEGLPPQLSIPGFQRCQQASYVAIQLPFDWWFWGLDNEVDRLDIRQQEFFKRIGEGRPPKLIVATPEPTTVMGKCAKADDKPAQAFADLELERPFLHDGFLREGECRLDLSGDTHHYARYWGSEATVRKSADSSTVVKSNAPSASNYASVVSGLGGAFFHPSHTQLKEVASQVLYPSPETSRRAVAARLFNLWHLISGGYVALLGATVAAIIYFAATIPMSSRDVIDVLLQRLGIAAAPATFLNQHFPDVKDPARELLARAVFTLPATIWHLILLTLSVVFVVMSVRYSKKMVELSREEKAEFRAASFKVMVLLIAAIGCLLAGVWKLVEYRDRLSPFKSSLLILFSTLWAITALVASIVYAEWLVKQARKEEVSKLDYWPVWALVILALIILCAGVFLFGKYPVVYHFSDVIFALITLGSAASLIVLAVIVGGELQAVVGKIGFAVLGAWHALLQLAVVFLLVRIGSPVAWALAVGVVLVFAFIGNQLARRGWRWALTVAWLVCGGVLLYLPFALRGAPGVWLDGWGLALRFIAVIVLGGLMSCVWLGWYMAVSLEFHGHTNEAGGAARIEEFKEFIRFRLTRDTLTGYVIGVDQPLTQGANLKMRLIDVFQLTVKKKS